MPGHWTSQGVELALCGDFGDAWNTGYKLAYTYTQPKQQDDSEIPNSCRQVWSAELHTSPLQGLTTGLGLTAASGRRDWDASRMDSYYSLRWFAQYEVNESLTLHLRVENLTNQKFVTDSSSGNILAPGTSVYGGCTLTF
jgi:iron complex outermembrane receptor protein